jgi:hypothetical protein
MTYITSSTHITHIYHIRCINVIQHYIYNICSKCASPQVHKCIKFVHTNPQVPQIHLKKFTTWSIKSKGLRWLLVRWERCERWHLSGGRLEDLLTTWSLLIRTRRERLHKGDKIASVRHD